MKVATVARQVGYLISYKNILENLRNEVKLLQNKGKRVEENLTWDSEEFQTQTSWLKRVDEIVKQTNAFSNYYEGKGACTNFLWRYRVGKEARKIILKISQLHELGKFEQSVKPPRSRSRKDTINDIMEALKDPLIQTVGVWGLGGEGTTSLAKHVGDQAKEHDLFDSVVMMTVTEKPNIEKIQEDIADALGLQFQGEMNVERRNILRRRIKKEKRVLVIVDDIWGELNPQEFDLEEYGVPLGDEHEGRKLLLASGNLGFIKNTRGALKVFQIEELLEDEALSLFVKTVVGGVDQDFEASSLVTEIVKSCAGSAPSIFAVAKALRNKDLGVWMDASKKLKDNVPPIKLCYNSLESEELKSLFLLLTIRGRKLIHKSSIYIDMWSGLFKNLDSSETARNKRDSLISELNACGLVVQDKMEWVKVDDLIWESAYLIAQRELKVTMISKEWPPEDWLKSSRFCSMIVASGLHIPEKLQCPELQEMLLSTDNSSMQIPNSFFEETKHLKVLDVVDFDCSKLPDSFGLLKKLQALSMYKCKLGDITRVGELSNLRMLGLLECRIQQLPRQIGQLRKLLFLDLRDTYLQVIPPNVLSNLTSLEELYLRNSFHNWEVERSINASLKELTDLPRLTYIEDLYVPDVTAWPVELFFEKLRSYTIFIGDKWGPTHDGDHGLKSLKLKLDRRFQSEDGIKKMLKNVDVLYLDELNGVHNVLSDLESDGFPHLQSLFIQDNDEIKYIAMNSSHPLDAFPNLESLSLNNLSNLEHICHGPLTEKSLFKIRVIKVHKCDGMTCLFSNSMIKSLPHLSDLEVSECKLMEAIVVVEGADPGLRHPHIEFPELRSLTLRGLPALFSFFFQKEESSYSAKPILFNEKVSFPNMDTMMIFGAIKLKKIWDKDYVVPNSFWKLKDVSIADCEELTLIFPAPLSRNLHNLKTLTVRNCSSLWRIFDFATDVDRQWMRFQLIGLNLVQLPKLYTVCDSIYAIEFPRMEKVHLEDILDFKGFSYGSIACPSLENVVVNHCPEIWKFRLGLIEKTQLKSVMLDYQLQDNIDTNTKVAYLFEFADDLSMTAEYSIVSDEQFMKEFKFPASKVVLKDLPRLMEFHTKRDFALELSALKSLMIEDCPELNEFKIGFATMYEDSITDGKSFSQLNELSLVSCHKIVCVISSNTLQELGNLKKLIVSHCTSLKTVFKIQREIPHSMLLQHLSELTLIDLPNLVNIINKESSTNLYQNLIFLRVKQCNSLNWLAISLMLKEMEISDCEALQKIIIMDKGDETRGKSFPELKYVSLENLTKLSTFFPPTSEFPSLETLKVSNCPALKTFVGESHKLKDGLTTSSCFFPTSLSLDKLKVLHVINQVDVENLWHCSCPSNSFCNLENLTLSDNNKLLKVISSSMIIRYNNLKLLTVNRCELLKEIFNLKDDKLDHDITEMLPQLRELALSNLSGLTRVWNKEPQVPFFLNLVSLHIVHCGNLKSLFSLSAAKNLVQLKLLKLYNCEKIDEVISADEDERVSVIFPEVECLILKDLPNLASFCLRNGTIHWPKLHTVRNAAFWDYEKFFMSLTVVKDIKIKLKL
ncbi:disease resistance protein At4g27190-like [Gastrolobium bilobum]|uniref:disease resistance protein At4g27190-like n=1 Tax=Gastrolobium bilobum TaxID=150636 RepID=UPI002AB16089|nr:disease resistance protein At4g27190-like [Gastrolobium bilobum]